MWPRYCLYVQTIGEGHATDRHWPHSSEATPAAMPLAGIAIGIPVRRRPCRLLSSTLSHVSIVFVACFFGMYAHAESVFSWHACVVSPRTRGLLLALTAIAWFFVSQEGVVPEDDDIPSGAVRFALTSPHLRYIGIHAFVRPSLPSFRIRSLPVCLVLHAHTHPFLALFFAMRRVRSWSICRSCVRWQLVAIARTSPRAGSFAFRHRP
jgi:hypothetical protein